MTDLLHISSSPHIRSELTTKAVMRDVILALLPTTVLGVWVHGAYAGLLILLSVASAVITEYTFDKITGKENTVTDASAILTGLLLALTLPARVPVYIPVLGSMFAILVVKCLFGGLGHNIMNPALAGRSFLLISFGAAMTGYTLDSVSSATPLMQIASGESVDLMALCIGNTSGVIGSSALGLLAGGIYLLLSGGITWEIPTSMIVTTGAFLAIFGGHGLDPSYMLPNLLGGGLLMAAFFMATDPVSSPSTTKGQLIFGAFAGLLVGLFRVKGSSPDSTTYAILIADIFGPIIDDLFIPEPYAYYIPKERKKAIPKPVLILLAITLIAGVALSAVYVSTADRIAANKEKANMAAFQAVVPEAASFDSDGDLQKALTNAEGAYGSVTIKSAFVGKDSSGNVVGYVINVANAESFDGGLALAVGFGTDGTMNGISFTELHETPGMGMRCGDPEFMDQFVGMTAQELTLGQNVDGVSGATITSTSVVKALNAAISFYADNMK